MAEDRVLKQGEVQLNGRLITSQDASTIGPNFQTLQNMRYTDESIKGVSGMTKINTTALSTHPLIKSGYFFEKQQPAESHVLIQAANAGDTERKVFQNITAIPSAGDFAATALYTDGSGYSDGIFSSAPGGNVAYCNGVESLIWGGNEHFCSGFTNYDPTGVLYNNYTEKIQNTLSDVANIATLTKVSSALPTSTGLLLHLNNNVTDSSTTVHTVTNNNVTFTTSSKFGSHAAVFNGTNAYLTVPDHADFDFSGGNWSIDFWTDPGVGVSGTIFSQCTDANNYIKLSMGLFTESIVLEVVAAGVVVVNLEVLSVYTPNFDTGHYHHITVSEDGDNWYAFINGVMVKHIVDTSRAANYTNPIHIGAFYDGVAVSEYWDMKLDEFRLGKATIYSEFFDTREVPYGTAAAYVNIGSIRPIQGAKFYVETANATVSSVKVLEWQNVDRGAWAQLSTGHWVDVASIVDGTASGGVTLAQDGTISFDSTAATSSPRLYDNRYLYWYKFVFTDVDNTTTISHTTLDMPFQRIKDLWDGEPRKPLYFAVDTTTIVRDDTINVYDNTYDSGNSATYSEIDSLPAGGSLLIGFSERITGIDVKFVSGKGNTTAGDPVRIFAWNGTAYRQVTNIKDGTYANKAPFNQSGIISWTPLSFEQENKKEEGSRVPLYYYAITFLDITLSADVQVFHISGITAQKPINGYKFPIYSQRRLFLCSEEVGDKNKVKCSAKDTPAVYNGDDSIDIFLGDEKELTAGTGLYNTFESNNYEFVILTKAHETWVIEGPDLPQWRYYTISRSKGCIAPLTMATIEGGDGGANMAIFQGASAIHISDGRTVVDASDDIEDVFDRMTSAQLAAARGFYDPSLNEYHWIIGGEEWVLDWKRKKWFEVLRGTGNELEVGFKVNDTSGKEYTYGCNDSGFMFRLENGGQFNGADIAHEFQTGDVLLTEPQGSTAIRGSVWIRTLIRSIKLISKSKATAADKVIMQHYKDTSSTATTSEDGTNTWNMETVETGKRVTNDIQKGNFNGLFHSLKFTRTTDDGFEPLYLGVLYKDVKQDS